MEIFSTLKVSSPYLFLQDKGDRDLSPHPLISTSKLLVAWDGPRGDPGAHGLACSGYLVLYQDTKSLLGLSVGHTLKAPHTCRLCFRKRMLGP